MTVTAIPRQEHATTRVARLPYLDMTEMRVALDRDRHSGAVPLDAKRWAARVRRVSVAVFGRWATEEQTYALEVCASELVTNALVHGRGRHLDVGMYRTDCALHLEVGTGCPGTPERRDADDLNEAGRGLFLVDALSDAWGAVFDGATVWCSVLLTGTSPMPRRALIAEWSAPRLPTTADAVRAARLDARTHITLWAWPGNVEAAVDVVERLVINGLTHGAFNVDVPRLSVSLEVSERGDLVIAVSDARRDFPRFGEAAAGGLGRGLWDVRRLGGTTTWAPAPDGKTVRVSLPPAARP